jgi:transposase-like protein
MDMNLVKLIEKFRSEDNCRDYLENLRWPDGVECPKCDNKSISQIKERNQFECNSCRYQFSVTAGTIFHNSHLPLWKWFIAIYLILESKKAISANQLKRTIDVSYKTAWYLCHRIRAAIKDEGAELLKGIVEVDETWIGGKREGVGSGNREGKVMAIGAIQREGKIRLQVIRSNDRKTLHKFIEENTDPATEAIYTDEWPAYRGIADEDTRHETVNHSIKEWTNGDVHTNSIENIWSLLKRSIIGSYHNISQKHLESYLDELEWRYNNRKNPYLFRDTLLKLISSESLEYKELTA